jgi:hypothetical protein
VLALTAQKEPTVPNYFNFFIPNLKGRKKIEEKGGE